MYRAKAAGLRIAAAALTCVCLSASVGARGESTLKLDEVVYEAHGVAEPGAIAARSPLQKDILSDPPAALVRFNSPAHASRELLWAAHASAANEPRIQRAFFLSAHLRF